MNWKAIVVLVLLGIVLWWKANTFYDRAANYFCRYDTLATVIPHSALHDGEGVLEETSFSCSHAGGTSFCDGVYTNKTTGTVYTLHCTVAITNKDQVSPWFGIRDQLKYATDVYFTD